MASPARSLRVRALQWRGDHLAVLDQTLLPDEERWLDLRGADAVADAIRRLAVRGAPLIGVAAGYGVVLGARGDPDDVERASMALIESRPTAINLRYAVGRVRTAALAVSPPERAAAALAEATAIEAEEELASEAMASAGADWLGPVGCVLTHCNTGALAAPGRGTALGVIDELWRRGMLAGVLATETRPLLQGARLTVYELARLGIPHELIVDSAATGLIMRGAVDAVIVGCDRVAANGDVANKVGTLGLALAARGAGIPFLVAGPVSTIDGGCGSGAEIPIEERDPGEIRPGVPARNPAFDVTPAEYVTALITDRGVAAPVSDETVARLLRA